ncbi:MAG: tetratricopeptide repeat protein [Thaumarchaeota archaeon]|nr:tetratricopeptide repeat protein [Nitrososphaerota archaeon]
MQERILQSENEGFRDEEMDQLYDEGLFLYLAERYEDAIKCYDQIIEISPSKVALVWKGLALQRLLRKDEAVRCYEKALTR